MPRKLLVAMRLEVAHHFIEGSSARRFRWLEPPAAFGAAETSKTWFLDPYQLPGHGHASYRTRISLVCRASYKLNRTPEAFGPATGCLRRFAPKRSARNSFSFVPKRSVLLSDSLASGVVSRSLPSACFPGECHASSSQHEQRPRSPPFIKDGL